MGGSGFRRKGHAAHEQGDEKALQREIDDLKKQLRQAQQKQPPSSSDGSAHRIHGRIVRSFILGGV